MSQEILQVHRRLDQMEHLLHKHKVNQNRIVTKHDELLRKVEQLELLIQKSSESRPVKRSK